MTVSATAPGQTPLSLRRLVSRHAIPVAAVLLFVVFAATAPIFGTPANIANILRQSASVLVLGLAMTMAVLVGGIDLSVGSVVLASAVVSGAALVSGLPPIVAVFAGIGTGALVGALNAAMIEGLGISPVIATLGTMIGVRGLGLAAAPALQFVDRDQGADLRRTGAAELHRHSARCRRRRAAGDRRLVRAPRGPSSAGCCMRSATRRSPPASPAYASAACARSPTSPAGRSRVSPASSRRPHRPHQPHARLGHGVLAIAVVALGAGGLPAGRVKAAHAVIGTLILMMIFNYMTIRGVPGTGRPPPPVSCCSPRWSPAGCSRAMRNDEAGSRRGVQRRPRADDQSRGAVLARSGGVAALVIAAVFAVIVPRFAHRRQRHRAGRAERRARDHRGGRDDRHHLAHQSTSRPASVIVLGAVVAALGYRAGVPMHAGACSRAIAACLAVYGLNGLIVGGLGLDPLIVTLAAWIWARGLAMSLTDATHRAIRPGLRRRS